MEKGEMGENATGRLATYYVAECMEFNRYGEYREDISVDLTYGINSFHFQFLLSSDDGCSFFF